MLGASAQAGNLITYINGLGLQGNGLTGLLVNAANALAGNQLTDAQAAQIITSASQIRAAQGCP